MIPKKIPKLENGSSEKNNSASGSRDKQEDNNEIPEDGYAAVKGFYKDLETNVLYREISTQTIETYDNSQIITSSVQKTDRPLSTESSLVLPGPSYSGSVIERIQVDAAHPFFSSYRQKRRTVGTSTEEDKKELYFCDQCKCFIYKNLQSVTEHFMKYLHKPFSDCVYCKMPVYCYLSDTVKKFFHKCDSGSSSSNSNSSLAAENNNNNNNNVIIENGKT